MGPKGTIKIRDIQVVVRLTENETDMYGDPIHPNAFSIVTSDGGAMSCYADNEAQLQDWMEAITATVQLWTKKEEERLASAFGRFTITIESVQHLSRQSMTKTSSADSYVTISYENSHFRTTTCRDTLTPNWDQQNFKFELFADVPPKITIQLFDEHYLGDYLIGSTTLNLETIVTQNSPVFMTKWYRLTKLKPEEVPEQLLITCQYFPNALKIARTTPQKVVPQVISLSSSNEIQNNSPSSSSGGGRRPARPALSPGDSLSLSLSRSLSPGSNSPRQRSIKSVVKRDSEELSDSDFILVLPRPPLPARKQQNLEPA